MIYTNKNKYNKHVNSHVYIPDTLQEYHQPVVISSVDNSYNNTEITNRKGITCNGGCRK